MKARIPPAPNRLPAGTPRSLIVRDAEVDERVLQAHVVKHVLGAVILHRRWPATTRAPWDIEGWPARLGRARDELFALRASLADLEADAHRCGYGRRLTLPSFGGDTLPEEPCYDCARALVARCRDRTRDLGDAYVDVTARALDAARQTMLVERRWAFRLLQAHVWPGRGAISSSARGAVLVSFGLPPAAEDAAEPPRVRIATGDGVRVELRLEGSAWRWRTTYGEDVSRPTRLIEFLCSTLGAPSDPVAVPRRWIDAGEASA
jgi:hypothetical protein